MVDSAETRAMVDATTQTSPSSSSLSATDFLSSRSISLKASASSNESASPTPQPTSSMATRETLYRSRKQPSSCEIHTTRDVRVVSLPETIAEKASCGVPFLVSYNVSSPSFDRRQSRVVSMPESRLSSTSSSSDADSSYTSSSKDNISDAISDICSQDSSVSTPRTVVIRSLSSEQLNSSSPLSSSCDSIEFTLDRHGVRLPSPPIAHPNLLNSVQSKEKASAVIDEGWVTWSSSPPRPIPALHGPASLPYARCPSGAEGVIVEEQSSLPRMIWGLDDDCGGYLGNSQRRQVMQPAYRQAFNPPSRTTRLKHISSINNNLQFSQFTPNVQSMAAEQDSYNEYNFKRSTFSPNPGPRTVQEACPRFTLSPTAPEFRFNRQTKIMHDYDDSAMRKRNSSDNHIHGNLQNWKQEAGMEACSRAQLAPVEFSDLGWITTHKPSLVELVDHDRGFYPIGALQPRYSRLSVYNNRPHTYSQDTCSSQSDGSSAEHGLRRDSSHPEIPIVPNAPDELLSNHLHRLSLQPSQPSLIMNSTLPEQDGLSLLAMSNYPAHPPGLRIPPHIVANNNPSEAPRSTVQPQSAKLAPYSRSTLDNPRSIPLSRLRQKHANKLPTVPEEAHYDVKLPGSTKQSVTRSPLHTSRPIPDMLQAQTMDEKSLIGKSEKARVKLPVASVLHAESSSSSALEEDSWKKRRVGKRKPFKVTDEKKTG